MTQLDLAPHDYTEMHRLWYPFIVNLVGRSGIHPNNREDVASDIFVRIMEWDILGEFNPDFTVARRDGIHPARFKNFLSSVVMTYVRGHHERQVRLRRRELQGYSADLGELADRRTSRDSSYVDAFAPVVPDHSDLIIEAVMESQTARNIHALLAKVPKRSSHDTCDLPELFDAVREQILDTGIYDVHKLTEKFGVSGSTMYVWIRWLRANLADIYGITLPSRRVRLSHPRTT